jgi:hypothetical protein
VLLIQTIIILLKIWLILNSYKFIESMNNTNSYKFIKSVINTKQL